MEKAYDITWRHGILIDINEAGIEGRMLHIIQNFLKPRSFKVIVNEILSDAKVQIEHIPQGSVFSPKFLLLKMNKIVAQLPNDNIFQISLCMDDLQMSYRHPNRRVVERKFQDSINIV